MSHRKMENDNGLKAIHFKGWINTEVMQEEFWFELWYKSAKEAEEENATLVVFKIPKVSPFRDDPDLIFAIEKLIQAKYPPK